MLDRCKDGGNIPTGLDIDSDFDDEPPTWKSDLRVLISFYSASEPDINKKPTLILATKPPSEPTTLFFRMFQHLLPNAKAWRI